MLLVRHQILKSVGRAQLVLGEWKIVEPGLAAIWTPPLGQDQRPVKDLGNLEFFVLLLVATPVATAVIAGIFGAAALLDRHESEVEIAIRLCGRFDQHRRHTRIGPLECTERQLRRRIGMLQGQDQLIRLVLCARPAPQQLHHRPVLCAIVGRLQRAPLVDETQIIDEDQATSPLNRTHFMHAVGIEGREADLRRFFRTRLEHHLLAEMLDDQFAAAMGRGQHEHHRREHAGGLLGIAVVDEEAAGIVDKKLIEVGRNRLAHTEPESYVGDEAGQGLFPVAPSDPNLSGIDLPSSPDFAIDHRLLAPPIGGCFGDCDEPLGLYGQDRKGDPAHAVDLDRRHRDLPNSADAKVARTLNGTKGVEQRGADRRHGTFRQAGNDR